MESVRSRYTHLRQIYILVWEYMLSLVGLVMQILTQMQTLHNTLRSGLCQLIGLERIWGALNVEMVEKFKRLGWYNLFDQQCVLLYLSYMFGSYCIVLH